MEADAGAALGPCRNCGAVPVPQTPPPHFCARCGQERTLHPPTLMEFLHEFVGHYVALEGPLWRSLALLLGRPGRLTREYLEGRRRRYVLPLRLYLSASFLFFIVMKLIPTAAGEAAAVREANGPVVAAVASASAARVTRRASSAAADTPSASVAHVALPTAGTVADGPPASAAASGAMRPTAATPETGNVVTLQAMDCDTPGHAACSRVERWLRDPLERAFQHPGTFVEHLRVHALAIAPYAIFLLLPVFAAIVMLAYRGRRRTYGEHFVFSLHLHAFWFLALLAVALLPRDGSDLVLLAIPVYGVMAMRCVYGGGWTLTILRATLVSLLYGVALLAATVGLLAALLATA